jgi:hypothetical protein
VHGQLVERARVDALDLAWIKAVEDDLEAEVLNERLWPQKRSTIAERYGQKALA